ncbi:MAG: COQ9 family protein [Alphaproteobacteria bacterium]|nr:COQ9 family protein [Alphaproteobacteria bacterium]
MDIETLQHTILSSMLVHVPFDGWGKRAKDMALNDTNISEAEFLRAFPEGIPQVLEYFMQRLDDSMCEALGKLPLSTMKIHEKVEAAIMLRLAAAEPFREAMRKAVAYYAFPFHADQSIKRLYRTTDTIWRAIGDHPTDFSFYTKRLSLGAIYTSTLLFWLDDYSESHQETKAFLSRRLYDLFKFHMLKQKLRSPFSMRNA